MRKTGPAEAAQLSWPLLFESASRALPALAKLDRCDEFVDAAFRLAAWDPCSQIELISGVYEIEQGLVDEVEDDGTMLLVIDDARLTERAADNFYEFSDIDSDDLAYCLGFENGDVIKSATDGTTTWTLDSVEDYFVAINSLVTTSQFSVILDREGSTGPYSVTLDFEVQ